MRVTEQRLRIYTLCPVQPLRACPQTKNSYQNKGMYPRDLTDSQWELLH